MCPGQVRVGHASYLFPLPAFQLLTLYVPALTLKNQQPNRFWTSCLGKKF